MKKAILCFFIACVSFSANAQQEDKLSYKLDYGKTSKQSGSATFFDNNIALRIPIKAGNKSKFTIGGEMGLLDVGNTASLADASSLKTFGIIAGYQNALSAGTILSIHAEPLLASDLHTLSGDAFRFKSQAIILLHANKKFAFGFGLGYQYQFYGSQLIPVITTIWRISDNVTLSGLLPIIPRLDFKLDEKWSIGGGINGDYSSYRLSAFDDRYIEYHNWSYGVTGKYKPSRRFEISALIGIGTRKLSIYKSDQTAPLSIYSWTIGGNGRTPEFEQKYKGLATNFTLSYKL